MFKPKTILVYLLLLLAGSCSSHKLTGSWEFIEVYEGSIPRIDTLKNKENQSRYGKGILSFYQNKTFESKDLTGVYQNEKNVLEMKYSGDANPVEMKISYLSKDYLLLSSTPKVPNSWFYKRIKSPGKKK